MAGGVRASRGPMGKASSVARRDGEHGAPLCPLPQQGVLSAAVEGPGPCAPQPVLTLPGSPGAEPMLPLAPSSANQARHWLFEHLTPVRVFASAALKTHWVLVFLFCLLRWI